MIRGPVQSFINAWDVLRCLRVATVDGWHPVNSPVEGQVVYCIIYRVSFIHPRWLFGISAINSRTGMDRGHESLPSLKLTVRTWEWMVGRPVSFWILLGCLPGRCYIGWSKQYIYGKFLSDYAHNNRLSLDWSYNDFCRIWIKIVAKKILRAPGQKNLAAHRQGYRVNQPKSCGKWLGGPLFKTLSTCAAEKKSSITSLP